MELKLRIRISRGVIDDVSKSNYFTATKRQQIKIKLA